MRSFISIVMLVGCGGSGSVAVGDLGGQLGKASCTKIFDCCTQAEIMSQFAGTSITSEAQCEGYVVALFDGFAVPEYQASIAAGRIEYDGDAAGACIDLVNGLSCAEYSTDMTTDMVSSVGGCKAFLIPKVADGGGCTQSYECISNNCVGATVTQTSSMDGGCMPLPVIGQPCAENCVAGAYCGFDSTSGTETCQATKPDGAPCVANDECTSGTCNGGTSCGASAPVCNGV